MQIATPEQIKYIIECKVRRDKIKAILDTIPTQRELAQEIGMSQPAIQQAIKRLGLTPDIKRLKTYRAKQIASLKLSRKKSARTIIPLQHSIRNLQSGF